MCRKYCLVPLNLSLQYLHKIFDPKIAIFFFLSFCKLGTFFRLFLRKFTAIFHFCSLFRLSFDRISVNLTSSSSSENSELSTFSTFPLNFPEFPFSLNNSVGKGKFSVGLPIRKCNEQMANF